MTDTYSDLLTRSFGLDQQELLEVLRSLPPVGASGAASPLLTALRSVTQASARTWGQESSSMLTEDQIALLERGGLTGSRTAGAIAATSLLAAHGALLKDAYTTAEAAELLGVRQSRIRQRRGDRSLWAIQNGSEWLFPALQFNTESPRRGQIRGLDKVFPALPEFLHPMAVAGFLTTPQPGLLRKGQLVTPLEWLSDGGDAQQVIDSAAAVEWAGV